MVKLAEFLLQRLYDAGCHDLFGVPGDFSLGFLNAVVASNINYVGTCNELNAAYAADGYARIRGIGAVCTTYAVGELSAINGVAGAWAESVPVVVITGAPARKFFKDMPLLHHTLGDYLAPRDMYAKVTCGQYILGNPSTAAQQIDEALNVCLSQKKPVYLVVPADMVTVDIALQGITGLAYRKPVPKSSDPTILSECVEEILAKLDCAMRPLFIPGIELIRRGLHEEFKTLVDISGIPYVTMLLSKGLLDECHPKFVGLYSGNRSRPEVQRFVDESDCVVIIGEKLTDFNTGGFSAVFDPKKRVYIGYDTVGVKSHTYNNIYIQDVLRELIAHIKHFGEIEHPVGFKRCVYRGNQENRAPEGTCRAGSAEDAEKTVDQVESENAPLTMAKFFSSLAATLPENSVLIAETGSSLFSAAEVMLPKGAVFIGQTFYGSIGYSVGACLGVCVALKGSSRKVFLLVGDGSFQVTCQDLSTIIRYGCTPAVFLINNDGYTIERVITDNIYNDIQMWQYAKLPLMFGGKEGIVVKTEKENEEALALVKQKPGEMQFIEIVLDKWDCNQLLKDAGRMMAKNNNLQQNPSGTSSPTGSPLFCGNNSQSMQW